MEPMAAARAPTLRASPVALLREPLFWAAAAVFVGTAVGFVGTFAQAAVVVSYTPSLSTVLFAEVTQPSGEALVAISLLGALLGVRFRTAGRLAAGAGIVPYLWLRRWSSRRRPWRKQTWTVPISQPKQKPKLLLRRTQATHTVSMRTTTAWLVRPPACLLEAAGVALMIPRLRLRPPVLLLFFTQPPVLLLRLLSTSTRRP